MHLSDSVEVIPKIGPKYAFLLAKLGIFKIEDLLLFAPYRYETPEETRLISDLFTNPEKENIDKAAVKGEVLKIDNIYTRNGKRITKAIIQDDSGRAEIIWFNQHYIKNSLSSGVNISIFGKYKIENKKITFLSPDFEIIKDENSDPIHTSGIVPVYHLTNGITEKWIRQKIHLVLSQIKLTDNLSLDLTNKYSLIDKNTAIQNIHFPENLEDTIEAKKRLSFEEFLYIHLRGLYLRQIWDSKKNSHLISISTNELTEFLKSLPFELTDSQRLVLNEILDDLQKVHPMNRLLQGDVGSGKTIVALISALAAVKSGFNVIYLAPTQILAKQHFSTFSKLLNNIACDIVLQVSDKNSKESEANVEIYDNPYIVIGTHSILHNLEKFSNVGLIIIDEQHKFGVTQRTDILKFYTKDLTPNLLTMTATPIPRSIALTLYGDLDLSIIENPPKNRKQTITWLINEVKRKSSYEWVKDQIIKENLQVIFVCPFIEESESDELKHVKAAESMFLDIQKDFRGFRVTMLHGRMKNTEKNQVIDDFANHKSDILVTTPVIEVGVDIPNANIIFIETAERFGLASLHQLRGRVGRGEKQGYCILMPSTKETSSLKRLKYLENTYNGQKLAEIDYQLRGPGNIYGFEQHGVIDLKIGDFRDIELIKNAREAAIGILEGKLSKTPELENYLNSVYKIAKN